MESHKNFIANFTTEFPSKSPNLQVHLDHRQFSAATLTQILQANSVTVDSRDLLQPEVARGCYANVAKRLCWIAVGLTKSDIILHHFFTLLKLHVVCQ